MFVNSLSQTYHRFYLSHIDVVFNVSFFQVPIWSDGSPFLEVNFSLQKQDLDTHLSIMAKRSCKQPARSENDKAGCMWGLINMFDFRRGHFNQKLLSDRKHGIGRYVGTKYSRSKVDLLSNSKDTQEVDVVADSRGEKVNLGMASVKTLMEEEMSRVHPSKKIPSDEVERIQSELGLDVHLGENFKQSTNKFEMVSDLLNDLRFPASLESHQSNSTNPTDRSSLNFDLATSMMKFYCDNHQCEEKHVDCKYTIDSCPILKTVDHRKHDHLDEPDSQLAEKQFLLHKALADVAEAFLSDTKDLSGTVQSKEFMDALRILSSNKELLSSLLEDPKSLLLRHIQEHQNEHVGKLSELESGKYSEASELSEKIGSSEQCEEPINHKLLNKQSGYSFFRKKDKSKGVKPSKGSDSSHSLNRIIVLKPSPVRVDNASNTFSPSSSPQSHRSSKCQEDDDRAVSHFSLKEFKRRLRHVIGESKKERHVISMDGILHRIPYGSKDLGDTGKQITKDSVGNGLASKTYYSTEHASQSSVSKKRDKKAEPKGYQPNMETESSSLKVGNHRRLNTAATAHPLDKESFDEVAKKHLIEMLDTGDDGDIFPTRQSSKSLGRLLSLPEYNLLSPRFSPGRDKEPELSPISQSKQENATDHSGPLIQDLVLTSCIDDNPDNEVKVVDANPTLINTQIKEEVCIGEDLSQKGNAEIVEIADITSGEECAELNVDPESDGDEPGVTSERCKDEGSSTQSELGSSSEKSAATSSVIPPCSLLMQNRKDPGSILEKPERPSPVSVLEPFFAEEVSSPGSTADIHTEFPICPRSNHFEEHDNTTVVLSPLDSEANPMAHVNDKACMVLEVSGFSCNEILNRWLSSDLLLDPSLFDEIGISYSQLPDDPMLLSDCIREVLVEIQERLFSCTPWVSFVKPSVRPIPIGTNLIKEVREDIDRHLQRQSPCTLDQIIGKDMDGGTWMDLRSEMESVVIKMGDAILEVLIEETAVEIWV